MRMYVYCGIPVLNGNMPLDRGWFAFEDGSFVTDASFDRARPTTEYAEAARRMEYARSRGAAACVVTVKLIGEQVDFQTVEDGAHRELVMAAKKKLNEQELSALIREFQK